MPRVARNVPMAGRRGSQVSLSALIAATVGTGCGAFEMKPLIIAGMTMNWT